MILTCPECATSYFVDDLRIPRLGRMVKCTNCGHRWRAHQDRAPDGPEGALEDDLIVEAPSTPIEDDLEFVAAAPAASTRRRTSPPQKPPSSVPTIVAGAIAGLVVLGGAVVLLRQPIAGVVPATASLFAAVGLPVNTAGVVLQGTKATPMLQGGQPVWSVTGAVKNVRDEAVVAPPIRLTLLDKAGKPLATMVVQTQNNHVPPGATRYFAITMPNPPAGGATMQVDLDAAAQGAGAEAQGHKAELSAAPVAAPVEAAEAQPLPADSPDALHGPENHEQH